MSMRDPMTWALVALSVVFVALVVALLAGVRIPGVVVGGLLIVVVLAAIWIGRNSTYI